MITLIEKAYKLAKTHPSPIAVKPPWLFWAARRSEVYDSGPHVVDLSFLLRCSMPGHKNWSTAMKIAHRNWKYIPRTDEPKCEASLTIPEYKEEVGCTILVPRFYILTIVLLIKRHFLGQWSTIIQITPINFQKHIHDWRHNCGVAPAVLGNQEDRNIILSPRF